jgi:hypothetical protein
MASSDRLRVSRNPRWPNGIGPRLISINLREYRRTSETAGKSGKRIERCVISTFQIGAKLGYYRGEFREWKHLLRVGE